MRVVEQVRTIRRRRWSRLVALSLIAAAAWSFAPRPAVAADHRCHAPVPQNVLTTAHEDCGQCAQSSCVAMPGCAHVLAVLAAPTAGPVTAADHALVEPEAPVVHDLASRGPPTPPPNR